MSSLHFLLQWPNTHRRASIDKHNGHSKSLWFLSMAAGPCVFVYCVLSIDPIKQIAFVNRAGYQSKMVPKLLWSLGLLALNFTSFKVKTPFSVLKIPPPSTFA